MFQIVSITFQIKCMYILNKKKAPYIIHIYTFSAAAKRVLIASHNNKLQSRHRCIYCSGNYESFLEK